MKHLFRLALLLILSSASYSFAIDLPGYDAFLREGRKQFSNGNYAQANVELSCAIKVAAGADTQEASQLLNISIYCKGQMDTAKICYDDELYPKAFFHYSNVAQNNKCDNYCRSQMNVCIQKIGLNNKGMVKIPAGTFVMGNNSGAENERPEHPVTVDAFYMDVNEVSNQEYVTFLNIFGITSLEGYSRIDLQNANCRIKEVSGWYYVEDGYEDYPAVTVNWYGARDYAGWLGKELPTEIQFEYAFGDAQLPCEPSKLMPVHSGEPNCYGLYNMNGNVWEWCSDWYYEAIYTAKNVVKDASMLPVTDFKSMRGGAYTSSVSLNSKTVREFDRPTDGRKNTGFRCVKPARY